MIFLKPLLGAAVLFSSLIFFSGSITAEQSSTNRKSLFPKDSSPRGLTPKPEKPASPLVPYDPAEVDKVISYPPSGMKKYSPVVSVSTSSGGSSAIKPTPISKVNRHSPMELQALPPQERFLVQARYDLEDAKYSLKLAQYNLQVAKAPATYTTSPAKEVTRRFAGGFDERGNKRTDVVKTFKIPAKVDTVAQQTGIKQAELALAGAKARYETKLRNYHLAEQSQTEALAKAEAPVGAPIQTQSAPPAPKPKRWWEILMGFVR